MNDTRQALLMIGSPKAKSSTSESLGTYLCDGLRARGLQTETMRINAALRSDDGDRSLLTSIDAADVLILAFPLYIDSLPAGTTKALEIIAEHRKTQAEPRKQQIFAIVNSGFPEADQSETALGICRLFAGDSGIEWLGGLALGGGGAIDGRPLKEAGGMVRNVKKALDLAAADISEGRPISQEATALTARPAMPAWLYRLGGNFGWKRQAKQRGALDRINDRPLKE